MVCYVKDAGQEVRPPFGGRTSWEGKLVEGLILRYIEKVKSKKVKGGCRSLFALGFAEGTCLVGVSINYI